MRGNQKMDPVTASHLIPILESHNFAMLLQAISDAVATTLGEELSGKASLLLLENSEKSGLLVSMRRIDQQRHIHACALLAGFLAKLWKSPGIHAFASSAEKLLGIGEDEDESPSATPIVAVAMRQGERRIGALLLPLPRGEGALVPEIKDGLRRIAETVARIAPRILIHERTEAQNRQLHHLHEGMLKAMVAPNRNALLAALLVVMNRHFGLTRIIIAQVNGETRVLRSEQHSGFGTNFMPFAIPLDNAEHPFIQALGSGEVLIHESEGGELDEHLPGFLKEGCAGRRVVMPLMIGLKPVGLIYADQPTHDGTPYFREVFEVFAHMAAAAIENLGQRLRAEQRAETDALTGLYNRYFLDKILEIEIPRVKRYDHPISLLMIDLCDFKNFNDTYGHQYGDYILRETANLLQANVRRPDIVVRFGGDEFVVLMVNTANEAARLVRGRIENAFIERNRMQTDDRSVIKISIGLRSADAKTIENLLHEADMEMYAHKAHQTRVALIEALLSGEIERIETADRIVGSLCNILYKKMPYYPEHARRVTHLALLLARRLGLSEPEVETLVLASLLHDVGSVSIPTEILQKTGPLTPSEQQAMRHHPALGEEFFQGLDHLEPVRPIIRSHHERFDGQATGEFPGYPDGLCGEAIPLPSRILKLAESAESMLYGMPNRAGHSPEEVLQLVREEAGKSFDPRLVSIMLGDKSWIQEIGESERLAEMLALEE